MAALPEWESGAYVHGFRPVKASMASTGVRQRPADTKLPAMSRFVKFPGGDHVGSLPAGVGAPIDVDIDGNVGGPFDGPFQRVYYDGAVLKCVGEKRIQLIPPTPEGRAMYDQWSAGSQ